MSSFFRVLTLIFAFLLVFSCIASMVGTTTPTFRKVLTDFSNVKLNVNSIVKTFEKIGTKLIELKTVDDDADWVEKIGIKFQNAFAEIINASFGSLLLVVSLFNVLLQLVLFLIQIAKVAFSLMFGINLTVPTL